MVKQFNETILNNSTINKDSVVLTVLREDIENPLIFDLSREIYLLIYNADVHKEANGGLGIFIDQLDIDDVASRFKEVINNLSTTLNVEKSKVTDDLINIVKRYYQDTATEEELNSRVGRVKADNQQGLLGKVGTIYNLNEFPDWDEFEKLLRKGIK